MTEVLEIEQLNKRGRVTIPSVIRKKLKLKPKDSLLFRTKNNSLIIKKVNSKTFRKPRRFFDLFKRSCCKSQ